MALNITKDTIYGTNATYWKVYESRINWHEQKAIILLVGYSSKQARSENKRPLVGVEFNFESKNFDFSFEDNIVKKSYLKIKEDVNWISATDDIDI